MTRDILNSIFLQIVKDMAYNPGYQIDTYRLNDSNPNLAHNAFGSTYQDYLGGQFWSRTFAHSGSKKDNFCGSYPVLMAEGRDATIECIDDKKYCIDFAFLVIDKIPCEACPPHFTRNGMTVSTSVLTMLRAFLLELSTYKYYEIDRATVVTFEWMSDGRAAYEEGLGNTLLERDELLPDISTDSINIQEWGNYPDMRAWMATVKFCLCEPVALAFEYTEPVLSTLANTECAC